MSIKRYVDVDELFKVYPFTLCAGSLTEYDEGYLDCVHDAKMAIEQLVTTTVRDIQKGYWLKASFGPFDICSVCGCCVDEQQFKDYFCSKCGADMSGGGSNHDV